MASGGKFMGVQCCVGSGLAVLEVVRPAVADPRAAGRVPPARAWSGTDMANSVKHMRHKVAKRLIAGAVDTVLPCHGPTEWMPMGRREE